MGKSKLGKIELDDYHYHEVIDRLHVVMSTIDDHLIQHPVLKLESDAKDLVVAAVDKLWEAYQLVADKHV